MTTYSAPVVPRARAAPPLQAAASLLALLVLWQAGATLANDSLFPTPAEVWNAALHEARSGDLAFHLGITLARVGVGFMLAMTIGSALGFVMGRIGWVDRWLRPWVIVLLNVPALVVTILAYVWLGLGETALLAVVAINKAPNVAMTLREGARALDRDLSETAAAYRFGAWKSLRHVVAPQLAPYAFAASRNTLALVWKIVLVGELLGRSNGVGFQLHTLFQMFDVAGLLAYSAAFVLCVLAIEAFALAPLERRANVWRR